MGGGKIQLRIDCGDVADYFGRWRNIMAAEVESRVEPPEQEEGEQNSPFGLAWWLLEHKARAFYGLPDRRKGERYFFFRLGQVEAKVVVNTILDVLNDLKALPEGTKITCDELKAKVNEYFKTELASVDSERGFRRPTSVDTSLFPPIPKVEAKKHEAVPATATAPALEAAQPGAIYLPVTPVPLKPKTNNGPTVMDRSSEKVREATAGEIAKGKATALKVLGVQGPQGVPDHESATSPAPVLAPDADDIFPDQAQAPTSAPVASGPTGPIVSPATKGRHRKNVNARHVTLQVDTTKGGKVLDGTVVTVKCKNGTIRYGLLLGQRLLTYKDRGQVKTVSRSLNIVMLDGLAFMPGIDPEKCQGFTGNISPVSSKIGLRSDANGLWSLDENMVGAYKVLAEQIAKNVPILMVGQGGGGYAKEMGIDSQYEFVIYPGDDFSDEVKTAITAAIAASDPSTHKKTIRDYLKDKGCMIDEAERARRKVILAEKKEARKAAKAAKAAAKEAKVAAKEAKAASTLPVAPVSVPVKPVADDKEIADLKKALREELAKVKEATRNAEDARKASEASRKDFDEAAARTRNGIKDELIEKDRQIERLQSALQLGEANHRTTQANLGKLQVELTEAKKPRGMFGGLIRR